jgi:hypothetical protein
VWTVLITRTDASIDRQTDKDTHIYIYIYIYRERGRANRGEGGPHGERAAQGVARGDQAGANAVRKRVAAEQRRNNPAAEAAPGLPRERERERDTERVCVCVWLCVCMWAHQETPHTAASSPVARASHTDNLQGLLAGSSNREVLPLARAA